MPELEQLLNKGDKYVKDEIIETLVKIGSPESLQLLKKLTKSTDPHIAKLAKTGIMRRSFLTKAKQHPWPKFSDEDDKRLRLLTSMIVTGGALTEEEFTNNAIIKIGPPTIWYLRDLLPCSAHADGLYTNYYASRWAAVFLMFIGKPAIPALIDALSDQEAHSQKYALKALLDLTRENPGTDFAAWSSWYLKKIKNKKQLEK